MQVTVYSGRGWPELSVVSNDVGLSEDICLIFIIVYQTKQDSLAHSGIVW